MFSKLKAAFENVKAKISKPLIIKHNGTMDVLNGVRAYEDSLNGKMTRKLVAPMSKVKYNFSKSQS